MSELKPCPFCGENDVFVERADYCSCFVQCNGCSARGASCCAENQKDLKRDDKLGLPEGHTSAERAWNTRIEPQWQDISLAPKDGTFVLCCHASGHVNILQYSDKDGDEWPKWRRWPDKDYHDWKPTHWIPLPKPPQDSKE